MKRVLMGLAVVIGVAAIGIYAFREPLLERLVDRLTADMFVAADDDAYDPGIATGERFPVIRALHDGAEVTSVGAFMGERGMIFIANRSVDW